MPYGILHSDENGEKITAKQMWEKGKWGGGGKNERRGPLGAILTPYTREAGTREDGGKQLGWKYM